MCLEQESGSMPHTKLQFEGEDGDKSRDQADSEGQSDSQQLPETQLPEAQLEEMPESEKNSSEGEGGSHSDSSSDSEPDSGNEEESESDSEPEVGGAQGGGQWGSDAQESENGEEHEDKQDTEPENRSGESLRSGASYNGGEEENQGEIDGQAEANSEQPETESSFQLRCPASQWTIVVAVPPAPPAYLYERFDCADAMDEENMVRCVPNVPILSMRKHV